MIKALLGIRFRALFAGLSSRSKKNTRLSGKGTLVLYAVLYLYVTVVVCGMMGMLFHSLAQPYHILGLDWLYFAIAALMGLGFGILGSVFTTQSQLYDAKDNDLLFAMPIPPRMILLSRMIPLLAMNFLFVGAVMIPAFVVYGIYVEFSLINLLLQILVLAGVIFLAQGISCLFGWLLHLILSRMNKSAASMIFMVAFLGIYFYVYSKANSILTAMALQGQAIADAMRSWAWPLYAAGMGSTGDILKLLAFLAICAAAFCAVCAVLSATFLSSATARFSPRKKKLVLSDAATRSPIKAIMGKELRKFIGTPVYLTNMGMGIIMMLALTVAGVIFRKDVMMILSFLNLPAQSRYLVVAMVISYLNATMCISAPSVSLEGKNIWILKAMPTDTKTVLMAKLYTHCALTMPATALCTLVLSCVYRAGLASTVLCLAVTLLLCLTNGLLGLVCGLKWAKLEYINEAYPCKQSAAVVVTMFSMMGLPMAGLLLFIFVPMEPLLLGGILIAVLTLAAAVLYKALTSWGVKKWDTLT